ncbi:MAG TPA: tetratricopeptide repeat protein [Thermoanaerobaculia bacterium]
MRGTALVVAAALTFACGGEPWPRDLEAVDHPDLAGVEEVAGRQLGEQRAVLGKLLGRGRGERRELAEAFGHMGRLYHAYELLAPAAACYANAERLDPASVLWPYHRGLLAQTDGRLAAARGHFARVLELVPGNAPARLRLGQVLLALNEPREARAAFEPLLGQDAFTAAAHAGLGHAALAAGEPERAAEHFAAAFEREPRAGSVRHALGLALQRLGRHQEARVHLERHGAGEAPFDDPLEERLEALAVSSGAYLRRANRALMAGRLDAAVAAYRGAVEADPGNAAARRNLALALVRQGRAGAAAAELAAALEHAPDDPQLHLDLGNARLAQGDREGAVASLRRALELAPDLAAARFNLANVLGELGRWAQAGEHLGKLLESDPRHGRARYLAAMALHRQGSSGEALARLEALAADEPGNAAAWQGLAQVAWHLGRQAEAVGHFRRAASLEPDSSEAWTRLANALQVAGQRAEAAELFARAVELDPGNATAWLSEASLHILAGDYSRAVSRLEAALEQVPGHAGLTHTLARLLATCPDPGLRDGDRALVLAQAASSLESSLEHAATVGMALAEQGRYEEAARWQQSLIRQAAGRVPPASMEHLTAHLRLYESGRPVRIGDSG